MGLVDYSDSDDSDSGDKELVSSPSGKAANAASPETKEKPSSKKVVDRSESRKIRVNLAQLSNPNNAGPQEDPVQNGAQRPTKRARTGGVFSGFNSFLPAPQNATKVSRAVTDGASGSILSKNRSTSLRSGVNLKTGFAPAFSRERSEQDDADIHDLVDAGRTPTSRSHETQAIPPHNDTTTPPEVRLIGKSTMFRPLSVARRPPKKRSIPENRPVTALSDEPVNKDSAMGVEKAQLPKQAKKSLFSTFEDEPEKPGIGSVEDGFESVPTARMTSDGENASNRTTSFQSIASTQYSTSEPQDLQSLADNLGLTAAQKRQLFGRKGDAATANVANFSLSAEYSHNNKLIETQAAVPAHNPVRSIAPGKHSLQQLVNVATSQKDALEESFASGKRNRKDAGNRYGW